MQAHIFSCLIVTAYAVRLHLAPQIIEQSHNPTRDTVITDVDGKAINLSELYHHYARITFTDADIPPLELELIAGFRIRVLTDVSELPIPKSDHCVLRATERGGRTIDGHKNLAWKLRSLTFRELLEKLFGKPSDPAMVSEHLREIIGAPKTLWERLTTFQPSLERPYHANWYNCQVFMMDAITVAVPAFGKIFQDLMLDDAQAITAVNSSKGLLAEIYGNLGTALTQVRVPEVIRGEWWGKMLESREFAHKTYEVLPFLRAVQRADSDPLEIIRYGNLLGDWKNVEKLFGDIHRKIAKFEVFMAPVSKMAGILTYKDKIEAAHSTIKDKEESLFYDLKEPEQHLLKSKASESREEQNLT